MRSAAKPWSPVTKVGSHGTDRARPLPAASSGMKSSKSSTSLAFESQLSKLKRASSEDMLNKPGSTTASGVVRLKKTSTAGTIAELTEVRLRSNPEDSTGISWAWNPITDHIAPWGWNPETDVTWSPRRSPTPQGMYGMSTTPQRSEKSEQCQRNVKTCASAPPTGRQKKDFSNY
uniref:Sperm antigen with calponin homology and coiled-coil domains 1 n=1 Tax=Molossus molossus TaxID=27622 RepID=A0A7J8BK94_MOLMO|nr:sperm antigen with calponin homology and coiled-coil domains 1 [Molossus molossus]